MTSRTHAIVSLATAAVLGGGVLALGANPPAGHTGNSNQPMAQQNAAGNQQVDRQVVDELHQFSSDPKTAGDKMFVLDGYQGSNLEIQLAQQALGKTQDAHIQKLAHRLIKDHEQLDGQFQHVAQQLGVELPQGLPEVTMAKLNTLGALNGHDYEVQLLATLDADHEKDIADFQATAANSQNSAVKQLAQQNTPILRQHLDMVQQTASALNINLGQNRGQATPAAAHLQGAAGNSMDTAGGNTGAHANQPMTPQASATGGQQVDHQIVKDLHQFASNPDSSADKMFVLTGYLSSNEEIQLAQQALSKSQNAQIQQLAHRLIDDHKKLDAQFQRVAQQLSIQLPQGTPEIPQARLNTMGALSGHAYEVQFLSKLAGDNAEGVAKFQAVAVNAKNKAVKQLAEQFAPAQQQHLDMVHQTASALGINLGPNQGQAAPAGAHLRGTGNQMNTGGSNTGTNATGTGTPGTGRPNPVR